MTPQEQIAYLRQFGDGRASINANAINAVCDLAERALTLNDLLTMALQDQDNTGTIREHTVRLIRAALGE